MLIRRRYLIAICLATVLIAVLASSTCIAQQTADIRQLIPSSSLLVAIYDGRADNPSIQILTNSQDKETLEQQAQQSIEMQKAIESFVTLFGISLDFAKDIHTWAGDQWAFILLTDDDGNLQPVFMTTSNDPVAANAVLQKLLAPWQRIGDVTTTSDSGCPITSFITKNENIHVYASAFESVVALSTSQAALVQTLKGDKLTPESSVNKVFKSLSDSMLFVYAAPEFLKYVNAEHVQGFVNGFGLGFSIVETGVKIRLVGLLSDESVFAVKQALSNQSTETLTVNSGIPSASLAAVALPDLTGLSQIAGMFISDPGSSVVQALDNTQISAAITAVLPTPAGVMSVMTASEQDATQKFAAITASLKKMRLTTRPTTTASGIQATSVKISDDFTVYMAQIGKNIVLASDIHSLSGISATVKGEQASLIDSDVYKETIAGLGNSNLLTLYCSLAPLQGLGYLVNGIGLGHMDPYFYGPIAKGLESMQALGVGLGIDGETANATIFLRAKPGVGSNAALTIISTSAIAAAVLVPVFSHAIDEAGMYSCESALEDYVAAVKAYAKDHKGKLPTYTDWESQLEGYLDEYWTCHKDNIIYAYNKNLGGLELKRILNPSEVVMFFEAEDSLPNFSGSRANVVLPHDGGGWFAYVDGHVEYLTEVPSQDHWVPKYDMPKPVVKTPAKTTTKTKTSTKRK